MGIVRWVVGGAAGLGLVGAGYTGLAGQDDTTRDESGAVVEGGELGAFRIRVGDCISDPGYGEFESVEAVPCSDPHSAEVYHAVNLTGSAYPGDAEVGRSADEACYSAFPGFVGAPYESSVYGFSSITPTEPSWNEFDDREILCLIGHYDGTDKTGTARGAAR